MDQAALFGWCFGLLLCFVWWFNLLRTFAALICSARFSPCLWSPLATLAFLIVFFFDCQLRFTCRARRKRKKGLFFVGLCVCAFFGLAWRSRLRYSAARGTKQNIMVMLLTMMITMMTSSSWSFVYSYIVFGRHGCVSIITWGIESCL